MLEESTSQARERGREDQATLCSPKKLKLEAEQLQEATSIEFSRKLAEICGVDTGFLLSRPPSIGFSARFRINPG